MATSNPLIPDKNNDDQRKREEMKSLSSENPLIPTQQVTGVKRNWSAPDSKHKTLGLHGAKGFLASPDASQLALINKFSNRPMAPEELLIGQLRLANNCIDRDNERFSEEVLLGFAETIVRKTLLMDHERNVSRSAIGKFYAAEIERLPLARAIQETGAPLRLPDGKSEVWFLSPWFYIPKAGVSEQTLAKLEAGIFDFASIGFSAERLVPVKDGNGVVIFHEYQGRGEADEGSFVFLGAQYGASIKAPAIGSQTGSAFSGDHGDDSNPLIPAA